MQRGILRITNTEANELVMNLNIKKYINTPLGNKLSSIDFQNEDIEILLSKDELETIVDAIGMVDSNINSLLSSAMEKVNLLMMTFME